MAVFQPITPKINNYGKVVFNKKPEDFKYLIGNNIKDIILFDNGNDELKESGAIILPRNFHLFVGTKNGELQFKPYEYDKFRIIVSTYNDIIINVDTIG